MEKEDGLAARLQDMAGEAAEYQLAQPAMAVTAHDQNISAASDASVHHSVGNAAASRNNEPRLARCPMPPELSSQPFCRGDSFAAPAIVFNCSEHDDSIGLRG